jgi:hypothetical protein
VALAAPVALTAPMVERKPKPLGRAVSSAGEHFLDMEGVAGSIPAPPTTETQQNQPKHSASLVDVSASIGLNEPRTVPKRAMHLGKRRAKRSHRVPPVERRSFAITDGTVTAGYVEQIDKQF